MRRQRFHVTDTQERPAGPIAIRKATAADADAIVQAFNETAATHQTASEWRRKFCRLGKLTSVIAVNSAGEVLAQYAAYPVRYCTPTNGTLIGAVGADAFAVRRTEVVAGMVFLRVMRQYWSPDGCLGEYAFTCGFPNEIAHGIYVRTLKLRYDFALTKYVRTFGWIDRRFRASPMLQLSADRIDRLWRRIRDRYSFSVVKDAEWYRWRFIDNPRRSYRFVSLFDESGDLRGWAAVCKVDTSLVVVDLTIDPDDRAGFVKLQNRIVAEGLSLGCRSAVAILPGWFAETAGVQRAQWQPLAESRQERMVLVDHDMTSFELGERAWISFGDADVF
jgi:hypothetical protein